MRPSAAKDAETLYLGNLNTVEFDLELPATGPSGSRIHWTSADPRFLTDTGHVTQPRYGMGDRDIPLNAEFIDDAETIRKTYIVHILEAKNDIRIREVLPVRIQIRCGEDGYLPTAVALVTEEGDTIAHAVEWDSPGIRFEAPGQHAVHGRIAGTSYPVTAAVEALDADLPVYEAPKEAQDPLPGGDVRLEPGTPFYERQQQFLTFLLSVDDDRMLYNFREASGLDLRGAVPMTGWDSPSCKLKGHTTGHYLSALAQAFAATGDSRIAEKARYMIRGLKECQEAFSRRDDCHPGFLSGYSEEQFDLLEQYVRYPAIWAPYYTLHKILAGLLDVSECLQDPDALQIARKLGLWAWERLSRLPHAQRTRMWSLYIAGEYGGMNEAMARLYAQTSDPRFLQAARLFDNDKLFFPLAEGVDALSGMHANQHIPQVIGALALYRATGEPRYGAIAQNFWQAVTTSHVYAIGGTGEGEMFHRAGWIARLLDDKTAESCASYNMLKLTRRLFRLHPDVQYMEYYERTLFNHILPAAEAGTAGRTTYFMPLQAGARMHFDGENTCCHGTGLESPFQFGRAVWTQDPRTLYAHLPIDSRLAEEGVCLQTIYDDTGITLRFQFQKPLNRDLAVRIPGWSPEPAGYRRFSGPFREGDTIECHLDAVLRWEASPDDPALGVFTWGPFVLAALTEEAVIPDAPLCKVPGEIRFTAGEISFVPLYQAQKAAYQVYLPKGKGFDCKSPVFML